MAVAAEFPCSGIVQRAKRPSEVRAVLGLKMTSAPGATPIWVGAAPVVVREITHPNGSDLPQGLFRGRKLVCCESGINSERALVMQLKKGKTELDK